jgi:hypothetical protein
MDWLRQPPPLTTARQRSVRSARSTWQYSVVPAASLERAASAAQDDPAASEPGRGLEAVPVAAAGAVTVDVPDTPDDEVPGGAVGGVVTVGGADDSAAGGVGGNDDGVDKGDVRGGGSGGVWVVDDRALDVAGDGGGVLVDVVDDPPGPSTADGPRSARSS